MDAKHLEIAARSLSVDDWQIWCARNLAQLAHPSLFDPMQQLPDLYAILGVAETAGESEIKKAYMEQARRYHPDKMPITSTQAERAAAEERFKAVVSAQEVLRDAAERSKYDAARKNAARYNVPRLDLTEAFTLWAGVVVKAAVAGPNGTATAASLVFTLGIPALLVCLAGPEGAKAAFHLAMAFNGCNIESQLAQMSGVEQRAFMTALRVLDDHLTDLAP
jgi:curved DNA-binding protein CbpA